MRLGPAAAAAAAGAAITAYAVYHRRRRAWPSDAEEEPDDTGRAATNSDEEEADEDEIDRVITYWFDGEFSELLSSRWFVQPNSGAQRALDAHITRAFGPLLQRAERGELRSWQRTPRGRLALILLLDQFSRHVHRGTRERVEQNDARALPLTAALLADGGGGRELPAAHLVFALMPLRHSPTLERLEEVLRHVAGAASRTESELRLLERFRKTTALRLLHLQGGEGDPDDVLERPDLEAQLPQEGAESSPLAQAVAAFLTKEVGVCWAGLGATGGGGGEEAVLLVSLSGGVDSMVLVHLLLLLRRWATRHYQVHALHVDYANRPESGAEAAYLRRWCAARGVPLEVRVVTEVTRGVTARDEYEKESRRIRFEAYADYMARTGARAVFFGHHKGDVQENVISNVMRGGGLLELGGMAAASVVNHVRIWRPMLALTKADVYAHAHAYGVPYFKDSTPEWSTRGKLRGRVQPLLEEVYGEGYARHLSALARESAECNELLEAALLGPMLASVRESALAVWFDTAPWSHLPLFFWRQALRRVCEGKLGVGLIRDKPLKQLLARIALPAAQRRDGWLSLKKEARALLRGTTLVLFRDVFPGHHEGRVWVAESPAAPGTPVDPPPSATRLGNWRLTLRPADPQADGADGGVTAVSLLGFLSGRFTVTLPEARAYAAAATRRREGDKVGHYECLTPGLQTLEGAWPGIIAAVPQLTPLDVPVDARLVFVDYEYM